MVPGFVHPSLIAADGPQDQESEGFRDRWLSGVGGMVS
jgi:hypothetical protein